MTSHNHAFPHGDEAGLDVRFAVDFHEAFEAHAHEAVRSAGAAVHGMLAGVPGVGVPEHGGGDRKYGAQAAPGGIALYAWRLRVPHPDGRSLTFCLPEELLPDELRELPVFPAEPL